MAFPFGIIGASKGKSIERQFDAIHRIIARLESERRASADGQLALERVHLRLSDGRQDRRRRSRRLVAGSPTFGARRGTRHGDLLQALVIVELWQRENLGEAP